MSLLTLFGKCSTQTVHVGRKAYICAIYELFAQSAWIALRTACIQALRAADNPLLTLCLPDSMIALAVRRGRFRSREFLHLNCYLKTTKNRAWQWANYRRCLCDPQSAALAPSKKSSALCSTPVLGPPIYYSLKSRTRRAEPNLRENGGSGCKSTNAAI